MADMMDELNKLSRLDLRKKAMDLGMERVTSSTMDKDALVKFVMEKQGGAAPAAEAPAEGTKKRRGPRGAAPPDPVKADEKVVAPGKVPEPAKPEQAPDKAFVPDQRITDLINRVDAIGTAVDELQKVVATTAKNVAGYTDALESIENMVFDIHKAAFHIYTGTVDAAKSHDDIPDAPEPADPK